MVYVFKPNVLFPGDDLVNKLSIEQDTQGGCVGGCGGLRSYFFEIPRWDPCYLFGAIALSYPQTPPPLPPYPLLLWKNAAESFTVALTLTLGGYESAIAPFVNDTPINSILYMYL